MKTETDGKRAFFRAKSASGPAVESGNSLIERAIRSAFYTRVFGLLQEKKFGAENRNFFASPERGLSSKMRSVRHAAREINLAAAGRGGF
jgi:hypothetical protein